MNLKNILTNANVSLDGDKIIIPENITKIKIDVGLSYRAPQSENWLNTEKDLLVFGFEPHLDSVESCKNWKTLLPYINKNFFIIPIALGSNEDDGKILDFYKTSVDWGTSSLFKPLTKAIGPVNEISKVPVFSLNNFLSYFSWDKIEYIEYIKIDAQGSDLNILKGADKYLNNNIIFVTAEGDGHHYEGSSENNNNNIIEYMNLLQFEHINHKNTKDPTFINKNFYDKKDDIYIFQKRIGKQEF